MAKNPPKNKEKPWPLYVSLIFVAVAALLRFLMLDNKPIHFDESINMWFVRRIIEDGYFTYDPTNFHGPLLFYLMHFAQLFTGPKFLYGRLVATLFSFLTLVLLWWGPKEQRTALRWSSLFLLLSPAMIFFGRSGIHESVFVFFQVLGFMSFHYLVIKDFKKFWLYFAGGLFGMMALKETFVILILALVPAFIVAWGSFPRKPQLSQWRSELKVSFKDRDVQWALLAMLLFFLGIYGGFGAHLKGIADFVLALMPWLKTGVHGAGHEKEFLHWGKMMVTTEPMIVAGFVFGMFYFRRDLWLRFYAVFAMVLWLIYSWIPYKTPWCLISILWPFAIVAGFGVKEFFEKTAPRWQQVLLVVAFLGFASYESLRIYQLDFQDPIDMNHPYVYVNSTYQMKNFLIGVDKTLADNPALRESDVSVAMEETWPFPIVFADFYHLNYTRLSGDIPKAALIYIVDLSEQSVMIGKLKDWGLEPTYQTFVMELRQGRAPVRVFVRRDIFKDRFPWQLQDLGAL